MKTRFLTAICGVALLTACTHRQLDMLEPIASNVEVVFDWTKAPDHNARSMSLYLFKESK